MSYPKKLHRTVRAEGCGQFAKLELLRVHKKAFTRKNKAKIIDGTIKHTSSIVWEVYGDQGFVEPHKMTKMLCLDV